MMRRRNLRVTEQLLGELEAGRFDSALTQRILSAPAAFPRMLRACFYAEKGMLDSARADIEAALEHGAENPIIQLVAGMLLFTTRDYHRALERLTHTAALSPKASRRARHQALAIAGSLGWEHDVREQLLGAIADEPEYAAWQAQACRFYARGRYWQQALVHGKRAVELAPEVPSMWMEVANLHARLDQREEAIAALERALSLCGSDDKRDEALYRREAVYVAINASAFDLAFANIERVLELEPDSPELYVQLSELHSWKDENEAAEAHARKALELRPDYPPALRMLGALAVREERYEDAIEQLLRVVELDPKEYQTHVWLTEAYLRTERYTEAHAQLHAGTMNSGGFLFVAWLIRFLIVAYSEETPKSELLWPHRTEEINDVLRELAPEIADKALEHRQHGLLIDAVEAAMTALRGNRSIYGTHVVDGELTRMHSRTGCRHESRWALQLLRVAPGEDCLKVYEDILPKYPGSSLPICHRGELHLWVNNFDEARADLEAAIDTVEGTRWAYIGLSTLYLLEGDYEGALDINARGIKVMHNTEGPAVYVYRGEAKRKLGRLDDAIEELALSVKWHPSRASATVNLALCYHAKGMSAELQELWLRLRDEQAAGLLSDAARELGVRIIGDPDFEPSDDTKAEVLEHALKMMGGNRSSGLLTYWTKENKMRFIQLWPHGGSHPHSHDASYVSRAKQLLLKALASYSGPRS